MLGLLLVCVHRFPHRTATVENERRVARGPAAEPVEAGYSTSGGPEIGVVCSVPNGYRRAVTQTRRYRYVGPAEFRDRAIAVDTSPSRAGGTSSPPVR
jgi:hypothetical protein